MCEEWRIQTSWEPIRECCGKIYARSYIFVGFLCLRTWIISLFFETSQLWESCNITWRQDITSFTCSGGYQEGFLFNFKKTKNITTVLKSYMTLNRFKVDQLSFGFVIHISWNIVAAIIILKSYPFSHIHIVEIFANSQSICLWEVIYQIPSWINWMAGWFFGKFWYCSTLCI